MRTEVVDLASAVGTLLSAPVFGSHGTKLVGKGRMLCESDVQMLAAAGHCGVAVVVLDDDEISEQEAAVGVAMQAACGSMELRVATGGRVHLCATENCCLVLDEQLLRTVNLSGSVTVATRRHLSYATTGDRMATVNTAPFAIRRSDYDSILETLSREAPLIQAMPIRDPIVGVLYTDPRHGGRARELFETTLYSRLSKFGANEIHTMIAHEDEEAVAQHLHYLLGANPTLVLVASTTSPAGPDDTVGRAMARSGCRLVCFMAPVDPGNLLLLGYANDTPMVAAPGCFSRVQSNVLDLVLPPLLARYHLSALEIASWGNRGRLQR